MASTEVSDPAWVKMARRQVRDLDKAGSGRLSIARSKRGMVELKSTPRETGSSVTLPFAWSEADWANCYVRIRNIYSLFLQGHTVRAAAELAKGRAPSGERDWLALKDKFKEWKTTADSAIKQGTWDHSYEPVISDAVALLKSKTPPLMAHPLILACMTKADGSTYRSGSRMRKIRVRSLAQFLSYCVEQHHLPDAWAPPKNLKPLIGAVKPSEAVNQKAHAFTSDQDILDLLASLPDTDEERGWRDATMLMAELGLRPVELLHLKVRTDELSGEPYWWCTYQKKGGNGATQPRRIIPLPLKSNDGEVQQWKLIHRWKTRDINLPPLESGNGAAECWKTHFNRRPYWLSLKRRTMELEDKRLTAYSFRHSFSVRGHRLGIDAGSMAMVMGHSLQTHCAFYPWAQQSSAEVAFANAYRRQSAANTVAGVG